MPFYQYKCEDCKNIFELSKPMNQCSDDQMCPECSGNSKRHYTTAPNFFFVDRPGSNIVDKSPVKHLNDGRANDLL